MQFVSFVHEYRSKNLLKYEVDFRFGHNAWKAEYQNQSQKKHKLDEG